MSGTTLLVGMSSGACFVFERSGTTWSQEQQLVTADGLTKAFTSFAIAGSTIALGATSSGTETGHAYLFTPSGATWSQVQTLVGSDAVAGGYFGSSVAIGGSATAPELIVGSRYVGATADWGAAYVFGPSGSTWTQQTKFTLPSPRGTTIPYFGRATAADGTLAIVGAYGQTIGSNSNQGAAYVYAAAHTPGDACSLDADCVSGVCTEGVCCDTTCTGSCNSCLGSRTGGTDGKCAPVSTLTACSSCAKDSDCMYGMPAYCAGTKCTAQVAVGTSCSVGDQCVSGFCADGVCCSTACAGSRCQACTKALTGQPDGTCTDTTAGLDPHDDCPGTSCAIGTLVLDACNGKGSCGATTSSCAPYGCATAGNACATKCTVDGDCGTNAYCDAGTCAAKSARGGPCATTHQCSAGSSCADGVCCDQPCSGQCQACAEPGSVGTCIAVKGSPRAPRAACNGTDPVCTGTCDGSNFAACAFPNAGLTCGAGCSGEQIAICGATGGCLAPAPCPGSFLCDSATNRCKTSCVTDADCVTGNGCDPTDHQCKPIQSSCSSDKSTSIPGDASQAPVACSPFLCDSTSGRCFSSCTSTNQCAAGFTCDTTSASGPCVPVTSGTASAGGGCVVPSSHDGASRSRGAFALLALVFAAWRSRSQARSSRRRRALTVPVSRR
ncbi:MAG: FG-GAP repeat protein [Polyangiales bacterium]